MTLLHGKEVRIWLTSPAGFKFDGRVLESDDTGIIIHDHHTQKKLWFPKNNIERIEVQDGC